MRLVTAVAAGCLLLAGCSSAPPAGPAAPPVATTSAAPSPTALAATLGCQASTTAPTMFAREEATCGEADATTWRDIVTFTSTENRDQWLKAAGSFGGVFVVGDLWAVAVNDSGSAATVKAKLGGEIR